MKKTDFRVEAIVLAAGSASRFGADKRLALVNNQPMLHSALAAVTESVHAVTVVLKQADSDGLPALLGCFAHDKRVRALLLDHPEAGMGVNLARAVRALPDAVDGVLVVLADMPYLQADSVREVVAAAEAGKIVAPVFAGKQGHPVLFSRRFFAGLMLLEGDIGARHLLGRHADSVIFLPVTDDGVLRDVDVPTA